MISNRAVAAATVAGIALALGALAGVGGPLAANEVNPSPDSTFYPLERAGESMIDRIAFEDPDREFALAEERLDEFEQMADEGKADNHLDLINDSQERVSRGLDRTENEGIDRALERIREHERRMERIENRVNENAREGIRNAINNTQKVKEVLTNVRKGETPAGQGMSQVRNIAENMRRNPPVEVPGDGRGRGR